MNLMQKKTVLPLLFILCCAMAGAVLHAGQNVQVRPRVVTVEQSGSYLGIVMEDVSSSNMAAHKLAAERGVIVQRVEKGSPAEEAGLQEKDVILDYAGMPVLSAAAFSRMVRETPVGRKVDLGISRDGKKMNLAAKIGRRESAERVVTEAPPGESEREFFFNAPGGRTFNFRVPRPGQPNQFFWYRGDDAERGSTQKPRLGVTLEAVSDQMAEFLAVPGKKGVLVKAVMDGTPAAGKLKAGDVIIRADDRAVDQPSDLNSIIARKGDSARIDLKVIRDKKEIAVSIELAGSGRKPASSGYRM